MKKFFLKKTLAASSGEIHYITRKPPDFEDFQYPVFKRFQIV